MSNESSERICQKCGHDGESFNTFKKAPNQCCTYIGGAGSGMCLCYCVFSTTTAEADAQREPELSNAEIARFTPDEIQRAILPLIRNVECLTCAQLLTYIQDLLATPDANDTRSRPTVEAAEIRRQAFDDAIRVCDSYKNENYAIDVCDTAKEIAKEIRALAAPIPENDSGIETKG